MSRGAFFLECNANDVAKLFLSKMAGFGLRRDKALPRLLFVKERYVRFALFVLF